jgi:23S rRNA (adenine2030-N6)-methyltransferase
MLVFVFTFGHRYRLHLHRAVRRFTRWTGFDMNYRHAFHAGNPADVLKHCVLLALLAALGRKDRPLSYIETHAGRGRYDLAGTEAARSPEYRDGVLRLIADADAISQPASMRCYVDRVAACNGPPGSALAAYPGSPLLAASALRADDRAILCETSPAEAAALRALFRDDARVAVHQRDGYAALKALLPPAPRRGLVLIDPPYEAQEAEFRAIEAALDPALERWPAGVFAVWYPVKRQRALAPFHRWLAARDGRNAVLIAELLLRPDTSPLRLNGAGMAILNPPWRFEDELRGLLPALLRLLDQGGGSWRIERLADGA